MCKMIVRLYVRVLRSTFVGRVFIMSQRVVIGVVEEVERMYRVELHSKAHAFTTAMNRKRGTKWQASRNDMHSNRI